MKYQPFVTPLKKYEHTYEASVSITLDCTNCSSSAQALSAETPSTFYVFIQVGSGCRLYLIMMNFCCLSDTYILFDPRKRTRRRNSFPSGPYWVFPSTVGKVSLNKKCKKSSMKVFVLILDLKLPHKMKKVLYTFLKDNISKHSTSNA